MSSAGTAATRMAAATSAIAFGFGAGLVGHQGDRCAQQPRLARRGQVGSGRHGISCTRAPVLNMVSSKVRSRRPAVPGSAVRGLQQGLQFVRFEILHDVLRCALERYREDALTQLDPLRRQRGYQDILLPAVEQFASLSLPRLSDTAPPTGPQGRSNRGEKLVILWAERSWYGAR